MLWRLVTCFALTGTMVFAAWPREIDSEKGGFTDQPPPHPLAYFQVDLCLRPNSDAVVGAFECTWDGAPPPSAEERERRAATHPDLVEVGSIGESTIYDLWYPEARSVLVKTASDQYREIDVHIRLGGAFPSSEIIQLGTEQVLLVKSRDGGNNNDINEVPYIYRESGPEQADFKAVRKAAKELTPANMTVRSATDDYESMTYILEVCRNDLNQPLVAVRERARITVTYRFADGRAIVTNAKYVPFLIE